METCRHNQHIINANSNKKVKVRQQPLTNHSIKSNLQGTKDGPLWPSNHLRRLHSTGIVQLVKNPILSQQNDLLRITDPAPFRMVSKHVKSAERNLKSAERSNVPLDLATLARHLGDSWPRTTVSCTNPRTQERKPRGHQSLHDPLSMALSSHHLESK